MYTAPAVPPSPATVTVSAISEVNSAVSGSASVQLAGLFAYVTNQTAHSVNAYSVSANGTLAALPGFPLVVGTQPFFVGAHPNGKYLYLTDVNAGDLYSYLINPLTGALTQIGVPTTVGSGPRSFAIEPSGRFLYVACTNGAGIYGYSIDSSSGALTALPGSPFANLGSGPASIAIDPSGKFAFTPNNTSSNVSVFSIDSTTGRLAAAGVPHASGSAPVWSATDPSGSHLYVLSDLDNLLFAYNVGGTGTLTPSPVPSYPQVADPLFSALSPNGKFLYVVNWFANVGAPFPGSTVTVFSIDPATGGLSEITGSPFATGTGPTSIAFDPTGQFAFVPDELAGSISEFSVNSTTGALTGLLGTVLVGGDPTTITIVVTKP